MTTIADGDGHQGYGSLPAKVDGNASDLRGETRPIIKREIRSFVIHMHMFIHTCTKCTKCILSSTTKH